MLSDRIVLFLPCTQLNRSPPELISRLQQLRYTVVSDMPVVAARSPAGTFRGFLFDLLPGSIASPFAKEILNSSAEAAQWETRIAAQCQLYHFVSCYDDSCTLRSDPLGLKPLYVAELPEGWLIASSIRDLLALRPDLATPVDTAGVLGFLTSGAPLGSRTLHERIRRSRCGEVFRWSLLSGPSSTRERRILPDGIRGERGYALTVPEIVDTLGESLRKIVEGERLGWLMPLTGGFDSRLLACTAAGMNSRPSLRTLGEAHHDEVRVARLVADALGMDLVVQRPARDILDMLDLWLSVTEGELDSHMVFIAHLLESGHPEGALVTHGFLGDSLSGSHINWLTDEELRSRDGIVGGLMRYFTGSHLPDLGSRLNLGGSLDLLKCDFAAGLPAEGAPYQAFVIWDMENRQRRFVGAQLLFLGSRFRAVAPNYDSRLIDTWLAIPKMALEYRTLLRRIFHERFPNVAPIPHCEEKPLELPRTAALARYTAGVWGRSLAERARNRIVRNRRFVSARDSYVWNVWHGATEHQHKRLEQELQDRGPGLLPGWTIPDYSPAWLKTIASTPHLQSLLLRRMVLLARWGEAVRSL